MDLSVPEQAYFFGFCQADGHLSQNTRDRGRLSIEISIKDKGLLEKFQDIVPYNSTISTRTRNTNFKTEYTSAIFSVCNLEFRNTINELGIPYGKKSKSISLPQVPFSKIDYFRGIIDADGSLGLTKKDLPFLSLCTSSYDIAKGYESFLFSITGKHKKLKPNQRDEVYGPMIVKEDAQQVVGQLYYDGCLSLQRKFQKSRDVLSWVRPDSMVKRDPVKRWTKDQDSYIMTHSVEESMRFLDRSKSSINMRLWRLQ